MTLIVISPYLIRNVLIFHSITITKSFGYNLWKGNNPNSTVEGFVIPDGILEKKLKNVSADKFYPIKLDKVFLDEAIKNFKEEPKRYLILYFKKFMTFLFIDINSSYPNYYNPIHYLPVLVLGMTSLIGIILSDKKFYKLNYLTLFFFVTIAIFSFFSVLPRYKLAILPLQIIFTNILIAYINKKFLSHHE